MFISFSSLHNRICLYMSLRLRCCVPETQTQSLTDTRSHVKKKEKKKNKDGDPIFKPQNTLPLFDTRFQRERSRGSHCDCRGKYSRLTIQLRQLGIGRTLREQCPTSQHRPVSVHFETTKLGLLMQLLKINGMQSGRS